MPLQTDALDYKTPYQQAYYPPVPTAFTQYLRTSMPWQLIRFLAINLKMLKIMTRSKES